MRKNLLVSFSGGETSAFMAQWLWRHKQDEYNMEFVFANTGQENEETLEFIQKCEEYFGFRVTWIEVVVNNEFGIGVSYKTVDFDTADRKGEVFERVISKMGIPNISHPHCTRDLKERPLQKYAKDYFKNEDYYTAIGIRQDEADRMNKGYKDKRFVYPLIFPGMVPMSKPKINFWWSQQPFRLELKGYQGNCKWCWKKSDRKLFKIGNESPEKFDFPLKMEEKYSNYTPSTREENNPPYYFFRDNRSAKEILNKGKNYYRNIPDDSQNISFQYDLIGGESCEVFSECGSL